MEIVCDRCSGPTESKRITSKKTGKEFTVYACLSGCMNGKFPYSCFAPRGSNPPVKKFESKPNWTGKSEYQQILDLLKEIKSLLKSDQIDSEDPLF